MIANVENVIEWLRDNKLEHWTVSTANTDNKKVFETNEDENLEDRYNRFRKVMSLTTGGRFVIVAKKNKADSRGLFSDDFVNNPASISGLNKDTLPAVIQGLTEDQVEKKIAEAQKTWETALELKRLKEENAELAKIVREKDSVLNRTMEQLNPHLGTIMNAIVGKFIPQGVPVTMGTTTQPINNINNNQSSEEMNQNTEITESDETRIETAMQKWFAADPANCVRLVEFIAEFATSGQTISPFPMVTLSYSDIAKMLK